MRFHRADRVNLRVMSSCRISVNVETIWNNFFMYSGFDPRSDVSAVVILAATGRKMDCLHHNRLVFAIIQGFIFSHFFCGF